MRWILQENTFNEKAYDVLIEQLDRLGIIYSKHKVIPFVGELSPEPVLMDNNAIVFGSYSMRHFAKKHNLSPGSFDLEEFDFTKQIEHWGYHMLNSDSIVCRFEDARFSDQYMFVRPILDSKSFAGKIFEREEFESWQKKIRVLDEDYGDSVSKNTIIQLSPRKEIYCEFRYWIVNGKISTSSLYKRGDRVVYENTDGVYRHLDEFVRERIAEWCPLSSFVIDVCETATGIKIVEINTINSCGFYRADIKKLIIDLEEGYIK